MNKKVYQTKEMADLFGLPVSTLHYWEKQGLIQAKRGENQYRLYQSHDIFDLWEIDFYRKMEVPIREIKKLSEKGVEEMDQLMTEIGHQLEEEIHEKERTLSRLKSYQNAFHEWKTITQTSLSIQQPDVDCVSTDPFSIESMRGTIEDPYQCCMYFSKQSGYHPCYCLPSAVIPDQETLWKRKDNVKYLVFGFKTRVNHADDNTISQMIEQVSALGYEPGDVVARYLFTASVDGVRYDHHKAWVEIKTKDGGIKEHE